MNSFPTYTPDLELAIRKAIRAHEGQFRKSDPKLPYITHLFHVAFILASYNFPQPVVIAGLLHDTLEDTDYTAEELIRDFGDEVFDIVRQVTEDKMLRWEMRKERYLEEIRTGSEGAKAVCCADKMHNISTIINSYAVKGDELWRAFSRGREASLDFYFKAYEAIKDGWDHPIVREYESILSRAKTEIGAIGLR